MEPPEMLSSFSICTREGEGADAPTESFRSSCRDTHRNQEETSHPRCKNDKESCEPIAIVGMAMRLPGGVNSSDSFWNMLMEKKDGHCEVPESRYSIDSFYSSSRPRSVKSRHGYFLQQDPGHFDADFFSVRPQEAERMDPQQRMLLEVVWECLENAGQTEWCGKDIGCYVGVFGEDWLEVSVKDPQEIDRTHAFTTGQFALSNRISYEFDFRGPSMTVLTACSSSLFALHEACHALYSGDCSSAIVAGVNLILSPTMTATLAENNAMLSPSGICRTFDRDADGYGRGEAINAVCLKPLSQAVQDGDPVHAVIRATATNSDGKTPTITTPRIESLVDLVRQAYQSAGLTNLCETGFFECHGTGTAVGDVVETSAIAKIFQERGIIIGSVKPNLGHGEGASGINGVIKATLALQHRTIPPNAHFDMPNPNIPWEQGRLQVPVEPMAWPSDKKERVSVNSFGIGGANVHVVLDSASLSGVCPQPAANASTSPRLLVVSAKCLASLRTRISDIALYAKNHAQSLPDLEYTLGRRREHLKHRGFLVVSNNAIDEAGFTISASHPREAIFVFPGQGSQWIGMGHSLMSEFPSFRADIEHMDRILMEICGTMDWSLSDQLAGSKEGSRVDEAETAQPLCTAVQIGLVNILSTWGIYPSAVVGHSSGEIGAAYASGAITLRSAIIMAFLRGRVSKAIDGKGAMAAVGLPKDKVVPYLLESETVEVACENSPCSVTISGSPAQVSAVVERIKEDRPDTFRRLLPVKVAYHSNQMLVVGPAYEDAISPHVQRNETMRPMFSTVTGKAIIDPKDLDAAYWRRNLESPVLFHSAISNILRSRQGQHNLQSAFVEIGPHPTLSGPLQQILMQENPRHYPAYIPTLSRKTEASARVQLLNALGNAFIHNLPLDLSQIIPSGRVLTDLPIYPWQHDLSYLPRSRVTQAWKGRQHPHHELLGSQVAEVSNLEPSWRNVLRLDDVPWLADHVIQGHTIFPAACYVAMAGEAVRQLKPELKHFSIQKMVIKHPLVLSETESVELVTSMKPVRLNTLVDSDWYSFTIMSHSNNQWVRHCTGEVCPGHDFPPPSVPAVCYARKVHADAWYRVLDRCGLSYGQSFRCLTEITADPNEYQAAALLNNAEAPGSRYILHPIVIDQCLQLLSVANTKGISRRLTKAMVPTGIESLYVAPGSSSMTLQSNGGSLTGVNSIGHAMLMDGERVVVSMSKASLFAANNIQERLTPTAQIQWAPDIDLLSSTNLLGPAPDHRPYRNHAEILENGFSLQILKTWNHIQEIDPQIPDLMNWKRWVQREAEKIRHGTVSVSPATQTWVQCEQSELQETFDSICTASAGSPHATLLSTTQTFAGRFGEYASGERSPVADLIESNALSILYECAAESADWGHFFSLLGHSNPTMRILEIGAGTGSTTARALSLLGTKDIPAFSSYTITDSVPDFLTAAKGKFQDIPGIEYKPLDITSDPLSQGFEYQSYDLVIASNSPGALRDIRVALRHVKYLLVDGGYFLLHEAFPGTLYAPFIMGLVPGWLNRVHDQTDSSFSLSRERWNEELEAAGFSRTESTVHDTGTNPRCLQTFSMISQATHIPKTVQPVTLVSEGLNSTWSQGISSHFLGENIPVNWNTLSNDPPEEHGVVFLLEAQDPFLYNMSGETYDSLRQYMLKLRSPTLWVTQACQTNCVDPRFGLTAGFLRSLRHELQLDISFLEIDDMANLKSMEAIVKVYKKIHHQRGRHQDLSDFEFAVVDGITHISRFKWASLPQQLQTDLGKHAPKMLQMGESLLGKTKWTQIHPYDIGREDIEVEIRYVGLNFKDIMMTMGLLGNKLDAGIEATGIVRQTGQNISAFSVGDHVAILGSGLFRTHAMVDPRKCIKLPSDLPLDEVATIPVAYGTAIYSLLHVGSLRRGQSVLIHSACGGVGLASIAVCRHVGAEIFCTVSNQEKVCHLTENLGIPRERIFDSRSVSFYQDLMSRTNGRGVDIVLNSLSGKLLHASWNCVAAFGKMIEIGKQDLLASGNLQMNPFLENRAFCGVDLGQLADLKPGSYSEVINQAIEWLQAGKISPIIPATTFEASDVHDAIRHMQTGSHMGKVLVRMPSDPDELPTSPVTTVTSFSPNMSYLLVGGLGGIGRAVSRWMVERGARHIIYLSPSAGTSADHQAFITELKIQGCNIICVEGDVGNLHDVRKAVSVCPQPLSGVMHLSITLGDHPFHQMSYHDWKSVLKTKVDGTWNLHHATQDTNLDFFLLFSSISGVRGNIGQANYAAASSFLDSFNTYRQQLGLPSSVIDLGVVEDIGLVSRDPKLLQAFQSSSVYLLQESEVIDGIQLAISGSKSISASRVILGHALSPNSGRHHLQNWIDGDSRYSKYLNYDQDALFDTQEPEGNTQLKGLLSRAKQIDAFLDKEDNRAMVRQRIMTALAPLIPGSRNMDEDEISGKPLDSLMAIEVRAWLRRNINIEFSVIEISQAGTIGNMVNFVIERLRSQTQCNAH